MRLQVLVARDRAGRIVETIEIDRRTHARSTPRRLKKFLQSLAGVARIERITTHTIERGKQ